MGGRGASADLSYQGNKGYAKECIPKSVNYLITAGKTVMI